MKYSASRLSEGNKVFPAEIHIEQTGLTVKIPSLFSGKTEYFDYQQISNVSVNAPMIGYSTITFHAAGAKVSAHGFTSSEVKEIKLAIDGGKSNRTVSASSNDEKLKTKKKKEIVEKPQVAVSEVSQQSLGSSIIKFFEEDKSIKEIATRDRINFEQRVSELLDTKIPDKSEEIPDFINDLFLHIKTYSWHENTPFKNRYSDLCLSKIEMALDKLKQINPQFNILTYEKRIKRIIFFRPFKKFFNKIQN